MRIKLTIIAIITAMFIAPSFADNAKTPTSKGYVDTQIATKQDKVPAVDTNTVITTTNTTGEIGEKAIYNASGNYAEQADALVTAADANAAVQNAIDTEFVCIEWAPNTEHAPENCYIWKIRNTVNPSKNMFNKNDPEIIIGKWFSFDSTKIGLNFYSAGKPSSSEQFISAPIAVEPGHTYTMSNYKATNYSMSNPSFVFLDENFIIVDGFKNGDRAVRTFTVPNNASIKYVVTPGHVSMLDVAQLEEGSTATAYQPYGENTYIPENR